MARAKKDHDTPGQRSASDTIAEQLRTEILGGQLAPQTRLRQDQLADRFGVSHIPVREALRHLAAEGLVTIRPHQGAIVSALSAQEACELQEVRSILERQALLWALPHVDEELLESAEQLLRHAESTDDVTEWMKANWEFHASLYERARRPRLSTLIASLDQQLDRFIRVLVSSSDYRLRAEAEHRAILAAYRVGNSDAVISLTEQHLEETAVALSELLKRHRGRSAEKEAVSADF